MENSNKKIPCWKIFDCWWETFDIEGYLKNSLTADTYQLLKKNKPQSKIKSLVELTKKN